MARGGFSRVGMGDCAESLDVRVGMQRQIHSKKKRPLGSCKRLQPIIVLSRAKVNHEMVRIAFINP